MHIRRPMVALVVSLSLLGGGALTACQSPTSARTGTPADTAKNTSGGDPTSDSQGNLPNLSNHEPATSVSRAAHPTG